MMKVAIRDDDVSFYTKKEELENIYSGLWKYNIKISLSVVPFSVENFEPHNRNKFYQNEIFKDISENRELVDYLINKIKEKKFSILLHGFSHQYKISTKFSKYISATKKNLEILKKKHKIIKWIPEYCWKSYSQLKKETIYAKKYLESLFGIQIRTFVPPSNDISLNGIKAIIDSKLNLSGTIYIKKFNRPLNFLSIKNYLLRLKYRIFYNKIYPYVMNYSTHKELCSYPINLSFNKLIGQFLFCKNKNAPFVLAIHYWQLNRNKGLLNKFFKIIEFFNTQKVEYCFVDELYD